MAFIDPLESAAPAAPQMPSNIPVPDMGTGTPAPTPGYKDPLASAPTQPQGKQSLAEMFFPTQPPAPTAPQQPPSRGIVGDIASSIARGFATRGAEFAGHMLKFPSRFFEAEFDAEPDKVSHFFQGLGQSMTDWAEEAPKKYPFLAPSKEEAGSLIRRGITGTFESAPTSMTPMLMGFGLGTIAAGPVGGFIAAGIATMATFGASAYNQTYEDSMKAGKPKDESRDLARKISLIEGGIEALTDPLELWIGVGKLGKEPLKATLRGMFGGVLKRTAKETGLKIAPIETGTEMLQNWWEANILKKAGMPTAEPLTAAKESILPAIGMSILFGAGAAGMNIHTRNKAWQALTMKDKAGNPYDSSLDERMQAVNFIQSNLQETLRPEDRDLADLWGMIATRDVINHKPIDLDQNLEDYVSRKAGIETEAPVKPSAPEGEAIPGEAAPPVIHPPQETPTPGTPPPLAQAPIPAPPKEGTAQRPEAGKPTAPAPGAVPLGAAPEVPTPTPAPPAAKPPIEAPGKGAAPQAVPAPTPEGAPPWLGIGKKVSYEGKGGGTQTGTIKDVVYGPPDGKTPVGVTVETASGKTLELKPDQVSEPARLGRQREYRGEIATLPEEDRRQAIKDSKEFDRLILQHADLFEEAGLMDMMDTRELLDQLRHDVGERFGIDNPFSPVQRANALSDLQDFMEKARPGSTEKIEIPKTTPTLPTTKPKAPGPTISPAPVQREGQKPVISAPATTAAPSAPVGAQVVSDYATRGNTQAKIVDGEKIRRDYGDEGEEFTNFGTHADFPFIPEGQVWIDQSKNKDEYPFFLDNALYSQKMLDEGKSPEEARKLGDQKERDERESSSGIRELKEKPTPENQKSVELQDLGKTEDGKRVVIVDGNKVRDLFRTNWTEGGHDLVYPFIPKNTIWIDNANKDSERNQLVYHEALERQEMAKGVGYDEAHARASEKEHEFRMNPHGFKPEAGTQIAAPAAVSPGQEVTSRPTVAPAEAPKVSGKVAEAVPSQGSPQIRFADQISGEIANRVETGKAFTNIEVRKLASEAFGGTKAQGAFTERQVNDAFEIGINRYLLNNPDKINQETLEKIEKLIPTQMIRTEDQKKFQQFNTPHTIAFAVNQLSGDGVVYMEPSAGIGNIAVFAVSQNKTVNLNELDKNRVALLQEEFAGKNVNITNEDAENIASIEATKNLNPDTVIMNPPFSAAGARMPGKQIRDIGAKHVEEALKLLAPNGRLVAIVGRGMSDEAPSWKSWFAEIKQKYNLSANVGLSGENYKKYGTNFGIRVLVFDKTGPTTTETYSKEFAKWQDLLADPRMEEIKNARQPIAAGEQGRPQPALPKGPQAVGGKAGPAAPVLAPTPGVGPGLGGTPTGSERPANVPAPAIPGAIQPERPAEGQRPAPEAGGGRDLGGGPEAGMGPGGPGQPGVGLPGQPIGRQPGELPEGQPPILEAPVAEKAVPAELTNNLYEETPLRIKTFNGVELKKHPAKIVEPSAHRLVEAPDTLKTPLNLKPENLKIASGYQVDAAQRMVAAHNRGLGFMLGASTGFGKSLAYALTIAHYFNEGHKKAVWMSEKRPLIKTSALAMRQAGLDDKMLFDLGKASNSKKIEADTGVAFVGYDTLKNEPQNTDKGQKKRIDQLVEWLGEDFDGLIIMDEAHNMGNAIQSKGRFGKKEPSAKALAGIELQNRLPKAKLVYGSATASTEVMNLAYAQRLNLWGEETSFANVQEFIRSIQARGLAGMELLSMNMKSLGLMWSPSIDYSEVKYAKLTHNVTPEQKENYDQMCKGWQVILKNMHAVMELTGANQSGRAKAAASSAFWGSQQRFFSQILTAVQMPTVISHVKKSLAEGKAAVVQLVNTNEASQNREVQDIKERGGEMEEFTNTPKNILRDYLINAFPTQKYEAYIDDNGKEGMRPVLDSQGNPVHDAAAIKMKENMISGLEGMRFPENPLDQFISIFGKDNVAEITGRSTRIVGGKEEKFTVGMKESMAKDFDDDKRKILIFSDYGGTGRDYHSDLGIVNQRQRMHYVLQPGWRADRAVQGTGRTHRTNQANAPEDYLCTTDIKGHTRFTSTIARRLDQMGALGKGQRQAGSQGLFDSRDNLESTHATEALTTFYHRIASGQIEGMGLSELEDETGLRLTDKDGRILTSNLPPMHQFLNRLLSMTIDRQNHTFEAYSQILDQALQEAEENGTLDKGMQTLEATKVVKTYEQVVNTHAETGAQTKYTKIEATYPSKIFGYEAMTGWAQGAVRNIRSGKLWAFGRPYDRTMPDGRVQKFIPLRSTNYGAQSIEQSDMGDKEKWQYVTKDKLKDEWNKELTSTPTTYTETHNLVTGAVLPVWNRIPDAGKVVRYVTTDGERQIGKIILDQDLEETLRNLRATAETATFDTSKLYDDIFDFGKKVILANRWVLARSRSGYAERIEIRGPKSDNDAELSRMGVEIETIQWTPRYFIPADKEKAVKMIDKIIKNRPIVDVRNPDSNSRQGAKIADADFLIEKPSVLKDYFSNDRELETAVFDVMDRMKPTVKNGALVYLPDLREAMKDVLPTKEAFDQAILRLTNLERIHTKYHSTPFELSRQERDNMIDTGENNSNGHPRVWMAIGRIMEGTEAGQPRRLSTEPLPEEKFKAIISHILKNMLPPQSSIKMVDQIDKGRVGQEAWQRWTQGDLSHKIVLGVHNPVTFDGKFLRSAIEVATKFPSGESFIPQIIEKTTWHEAFEGTKYLLTDEEKKFLKKAFPTQADAQGNLKNTLEVQADAFADWAMSNRAAGEPGPLGAIWQKIKNFFVGLKSYLNGEGFYSVDDVFGRTYSGEVKSRAQEMINLGQTPGRMFTNNNDTLPSLSVDSLQNLDRYASHNAASDKDFITWAKNKMGYGFIENKDLHVWEQHLSLPWYLAKKYPAMKSLIDDQISREETRSAGAAQYNDAASAFYNLRGPELEKVEKALISGDKENFIYTNQDLTDRFGLSPTGREAYHSVRAVFEQLLKRWVDHSERMLLRPYEKTLNDAEYTQLQQVYDKHLNPDTIATLLPAVARAYGRIQPRMNIIRRIRSDVRRFKGYFPRYRKPGEFYVSVVEEQETEQGNKFNVTKLFTFANSQRETMQIVKELQESYQEEQNIHVSYGRYTAEPESAFFGLSDMNMQRMIDSSIDKIKKDGKIDPEQTEDLRFALSQSVAETLLGRGAGQRMIKRSDQIIEGYETTGLKQIMKNYISGYMGMETKLDAAFDFMETLQTIPKEQPKLFGEASNYAETMLRNYEKMDKQFSKLRGLAFTYYLSLSIRGAAMQFTQNFVTGIPFLARVMKPLGGGPLASERQYTKAMWDTAMGLNMNEEEKMMIHQMLSSGIANDQYIRQISREIRGGMSSMAGKITDIMAAPFSKMEIFNRKSAALASYRVFRKLGMNEQEAFEKTRDYIYDTHYLMTKANLPHAARSGDVPSQLIGTAYTFRRFTHNYILSMIYSLKGPDGKFHIGNLDVLARSLAWLAVFGGLGGLPFIDDLLDEMENFFGRPFRSEIRKTLRDVGGAPMEQLGIAGIPAMLGQVLPVGVDLSGSLRIGLPSLSDPLKGAEETVAGVWGGLAKKGQNAWKQVGLGEYMRAFENASPIFIENLLKASRMATIGSTTPTGKVMFDDKGKPIKETTAEATAQAVGLRPERISLMARTHREFGNIESHYTATRDDLYAKFRLAQTPEARQEVIKDVQKYNLEVSKYRGVIPLINAESLRRSFGAKPEKKYTRFGNLMMTNQ